MRGRVVLFAVIALFFFAACGTEERQSLPGPSAGALGGKADGFDETWQEMKLLAVANGLGVGAPHWAMEDIAKYEMGFTDEEWDALSFLQEPITSRADLEALIGAEATLAVEAYARQYVERDAYWLWLTRIATGDAHATTGVKVWGTLDAYYDMDLAAQAGDQIALRLVRFCGRGWNPRVDLWGGSLDLLVNPPGSADVEIPDGAFGGGSAASGVTLDADRMRVSIENRGAELGYFLFEIQCVGGPCLSRPSTHERWDFLLDEATLRARLCPAALPPPPTEDSDALCSDGIDNDGDGYVDCVDHDCRKNPLVTLCVTAPEADDVSCADGIDNDLDGYTDCDDYDCSLNGAITVCAPPPPPAESEDNDARCSDGLDNDGDSAIDCADSDCSQNPTITVCAAPPATELEAIYAARVAKAKVLSYYEARTFLFSVLDNVGGQVMGVYTGESIYTSGIPDVGVMNTEHSWPNSWVLAVDVGFFSDLNHLFPTKSWINQERGARPFCEVAVIQGSHWAGSRWGLGVDGQECFEPRDEHKGDAARAMFYVSAAYALPMEDGMEATLRSWHREDPPDVGEAARNAAITTAQGYANIFVTSPDKVDQISNF